MKSNSTLMMALGAILAFFGPLDGKPAVMVEGLLSLGEEAHAPAKDNESYGFSGEGANEPSFPVFGTTSLIP